MPEITDRVYREITGRAGMPSVRILISLKVDGVEYIKIDDYEEQAVFMPKERWPRIPTSDKELYVLEDENRLTPLEEWKAR